MNAVLGFSEVLLEQMFGPVNERQEEYLRDIHGSGRHLLELLNEILDLSKVEAGRMDLEYASVDVGPVIEETASMLRERAAAHDITLSLDVADDIGTAYTDQLRLKQVLLNLMTNAVKFTGDGGQVTVRAVHRGAQIDIEITDNGIGVPEADQERIFESFQQGGRGSSREEGTGLGLTLSRRLVELLGGKMWLTSEVGVGSTFGFSVPDRPESDEAGVRDEHDEPLLGEVVVIEDDRPSLELLNAYLDRGGVPGHRGPRRHHRARDGTTDPSDGCPPGHPPPGDGRLVGARGPQAGPRHGRHPRDRRVDRRRPGPRSGARRGRAAGEAGQP